jgi:hypothetical protein
MTNVEKAAAKKEDGEGDEDTGAQQERRVPRERLAELGHRDSPV